MSTLDETCENTGADRAAAVVGFASDQLSGFHDVLAYLVVAVTKEHHAAMRLSAPNRGATEETKVESEKAISEVYDAIFHLFSHEMKSDEGRARVHRMFETLYARGAQARREQKVLLDGEYASLASSVRWMGQSEGAAARKESEASPPESVREYPVTEQTWNWIVGEVGFDVRGTPYEEQLRAVHSDAWMKGFEDGFPGGAEPPCPCP